MAALTITNPFSCAIPKVNYWNGHTAERKGDCIEEKENQ